MKVTILASAVLAACAASAAPNPRPEPVLQLRAAGFNFGAQKVRGVNAGGWLVLEPWITPSLWAYWNNNPGAGPVDEYHLCQRWGKVDCLRRLQRHWDTFMTQADFQKMAARGLNTVRIPIGYWAFTLLPGDPYVQGQQAYLDRAIGWARSAGLKVWIDLHGAPGSQNGFDNSGLRDQINWQKGDTIGQTLGVLRQIASKYSKAPYSDTVVVIELLNEPLGPNLDFTKLRQFYYDGFGNVRNYGSTWIAISDAFKQVSQWNGILNSNTQKVLLDHHHYQVFSPGEVSRSFDQQISVACGARTETQGSRDKYVVVGEWSGAMTDCAKWLNGFNRYARYEGRFPGSWWVGSCSGNHWGDLTKMSWTQKQNLRKYIEAQILSWETAAGWIFWTWKAEGGNMNDDWNMSKLFDWGLIPRPGTTPKYPRICG
ncbi:hypothetical protein H072_3516 [Dactylellina haptotyla CBS 200.50]|uniref:glucan 1,3-beta-glucosidase n=1 Tax=Dactylellina haptotyla (strain CBS 200.50) TaxID=1284197 RepID=S8AN01_DACHA|nr:hypothetical protein H072_3516 [Dactylellina haptotyla CBS 200.50]